MRAFAPPRSRRARACGVALDIGSFLAKITNVDERFRLSRARNRNERVFAKVDRRLPTPSSTYLAGPCIATARKRSPSQIATEQPDYPKG